MLSIRPFLPATVGGVIAALIPSMALVTLNVKRYWEFYHPQTCFDCGAEIGVPFAFWVSEAFVGGNEILWAGLLADILFGVILVVLGGMVGDRVYRQLRESREASGR